MPNPSTTEAAPERRAARSKSRKVAQRRAPKGPRSELELDTPRMQTIWMLASIAGATILMWGLGRAACNYHPPRETRRPRTVSAAELARDPKGAAIEMVQRWSTHDFSGALELASGPVAEELKKELLACEARADACHREQVALSNSIITSATLIRKNPESATAKVATIGPGGQTHNYKVELAPAGPLWKVRSRKPDLAR